MFNGLPSVKALHFLHCYCNKSMMFQGYCLFMHPSVTYDRDCEAGNKGLTRPGRLMKSEG